MASCAIGMTVPGRQITGARRRCARWCARRVCLDISRAGSVPIGNHRCGRSQGLRLNFNQTCARKAPRYDGAWLANRDARKAAAEPIWDESRTPRAILRSGDFGAEAPKAAAHIVILCKTTLSGGGVIAADFEALRRGGAFQAIHADGTTARVPSAARTYTAVCISTSAPS